MFTVEYGPKIVSLEECKVRLGFRLETIIEKVAKDKMS
jgi:hypothetical protein